MKKSNLLILSTALVMCLSSCVSKRSVNTSINLNDKVWHLSSFDGKDKSVFADTTSFNIRFVNDSTINGIGACNRFFGNYKASKDGIININMGGATKMACPNMDVEQNFFIALDDVNQYQIKGNELTLLKGKEVIATFK